MNEAADAYKKHVGRDPMTLISGVGPERVMPKPAALRATPIQNIQRRRTLSEPVSISTPVYSPLSSRPLPYRTPRMNSERAVVVAEVDSL